MKLAVMGGSSKRNAKMHLESINIEAADYGGFIVRCSYEGKGGEQEPGLYESKTKVFTKASKLASFVEEAMEELGVELDEEDEEDEEED